VEVKGAGMEKIQEGSAAVFQDPYESVNPFYKMSHVLMGPIRKFKLAHSEGEAPQAGKRGASGGRSKP